MQLSFHCYFTLNKVISIVILIDLGIVNFTLSLLWEQSLICITSLHGFSSVDMYIQTSLLSLDHLLEAGNCHFTSLLSSYSVNLETVIPLGG